MTFTAITFCFIFLTSLAYGRGEIVSLLPGGLSFFNLCPGVFE
jgi:hypothetical protein